MKLLIQTFIIGAAISLAGGALAAEIDKSSPKLMEASKAPKEIDKSTPKLMEAGRAQKEVDKSTPKLMEH